MGFRIIPNEAVPPPTETLANPPKLYQSLKTLRCWYVDCYGPDDSEFPLNSYGPHFLDFAMEISERVLGSENSGIVSVSVSKESKGCSPMRDPGEKDLGLKDEDL